MKSDGANVTKSLIPNEKYVKQLSHATLRQWKKDELRNWHCVEDAKLMENIELKVRKD